jgi:hypothetical protein
MASFLDRIRFLQTHLARVRICSAAVRVADMVNGYSPFTMSIAKGVQVLKANSSGWMNEVRSFEWQEGYFACSVSRSQIPRVMKYIAAQQARFLACCGGCVVAQYPRFSNNKP